MTLHIDLVGRDDLSGEIYRQIRRAILEGLLRPGDTLPPTRELARTLAVARATVVVAYEHLAAEGFVQSRQGAGTIVEDWAPLEAAGARRQRSHGALRPRPIWETIPLPTAFDASAIYDFRTGLPDVSLFPHLNWRRLIAKVLRSNESALPGIYEKPAGHLALRTAIARHIGVSRGVDASEDDVIVTGGTQQAIDLLARTLLAPGDKIAIEDPGYEATRRALEAHGAKVIGVPVDQDGIVVEALPDDARAVYVTPSHQYPLSVTMTLGRRQALLSWAERHGSAIIEDDYDGEFRFDGRPLPPLQTLDTAGRVIYVGSFSKTMFPTLRLGFVVPPPSLRDAIQRAKYVSDWHSPTLEQAALARFIESGGFSAHIRKVSAVYRERHSMIATAITRDFAGLLELIPSTTGLHLTALAPPSTTVEQMSEIAARAAKRGVQLHRLSSFHLGQSCRAGLVLGYGAIATPKIAEGLVQLRAAFED